MSPHISAKSHQIAPLVLITGDPLRAQKMSQLLTNCQLVSSLRNNYIYTGEYKGVAVSVAGVGIGHGSVAIYVQELYQFYNVQVIIRVGSCGTFTDLKLMEIVNVTSAYSPFLYYQDFFNDHWAPASSSLLKHLQTTNRLLGQQPLPNVKAASDANFYILVGPKEHAQAIVEEQKVVEMEAYTLFVLAKFFNRNAACLLTVSDQLEYVASTRQYRVKAKLTAKQRQEAFKPMFKLAFETLIIWDSAMIREEKSY